jgi:hypothetical protein
LTLAETSAVIASAPSSHATAEIMKKNHEIMEKDHLPPLLTPSYTAYASPAVLSQTRAACEVSCPWDGGRGGGAGAGCQDDGAMMRHRIRVLLAVGPVGRCRGGRKLEAFMRSVERALEEWGCTGPVRAETALQYERYLLPPRVSSSRIPTYAHPALLALHRHIRTARRARR